MARNQSQIKICVMAMLSIVAVVFAFVQIVSAQTQASAAANQDDEPSSEVMVPGDSCSLQLTIHGNGSLFIENNGRDRQVLRTSDQLKTSCGDAIELIAIPDAGWRFDHWEGVAEDLQFKAIITVNSPALVTAVFMQREVLRYEPLDEPFVDRGGQIVTEVPVLESVWRESLAASEENDPPVIDVWYGEEQPFGQHGNPQSWVNILGNVTDPNQNLQKLEYILNDDLPVKLNVGGDGHKGDGLRLYRQGDFNIDLDKADLDDGPNTVVIKATDTEFETTATVTVNYDPGNFWELPYGIDWGSAGTIQSVAQIVDGKWSHTADGVRPVETGYDRIIAIGDASAWTEFELTVPVTVHGFAPEGFGGRQVAPAIGLVMHWGGHTTTPDFCDQPLCGYLPVGAASWYAFESEDSEAGQFSMWVRPGNPTPAPPNVILQWGKTYYWKVRSEMLPGTYRKFRMKVWPKGEAEPGDWLLSIDGTDNSLQAGSALLLTHHVDVTFGDVSVIPITAGEGSPDIFNLKVIPEPQGATVRWETDEPASSRVDYGTTAGYGQSVQAQELVTEHSLYLPDLNPQKEYHYQITSKDAGNESSFTSDKTFKTQELITLVSDDFNVCSLDPAWEFIDPLGDSSLVLNGIQAQISVPAGTNHDIWPPGPPLNRAPRLMHAVTDPHNLKLKFDSLVDVEIAEQGILLEQDEDNFLRINYQYKKGNLQLVIIGFKPGGNETLRSINLSDLNPDESLYLWLTRQDGQWQLAYSADDQNWSNVGAFTFPLSVTKAGIFAGNAGDNPAFTALVDYYFDAANPRVPEDGNALHLPANVVGNGSVIKDPICGSPVTLRAEADPGWRFVEWQGAGANGLTRLEVTTEFANGDEVTAVFEVGEPEKYTLDIQTNGQGDALKDPDQSEYIAGEVVELAAIPASGWAFDSWGGALSGTDPVISFEMDSDKSVIANFKEAELNLDIKVEGPGQVQLSPLGPYDYGQQVTLTAVPAAGSLASFGGWSGDMTSSDNPLILEITEDMALTATFVTYKQFLPVTIGPSG